MLIEVNVIDILVREVNMTILYLFCTVHQLPKKRPLSQSANSLLVSNTVSASSRVSNILNHPAPPPPPPPLVGRVGGGGGVWCWVGGC
jgi:hypothetical protein